MIAMNIHIPSDNGSIGQALEDLDAKLAAWTEVIKEVQSELEAGTDRDVQPTEVEQGVLAESEVKDTRPDIPEVPEERESTATDIDTEVAQSCVEDESDDRADSLTDEDEELLASLDEETVAKIRVMGRLTSDKTSVRELLEKSRATEQPAKEEQPPKKSWFFGKRG